MQIGMGGGMKAGINIWLALRNNSTVHKVWRHLAARPLTEADLPRPIRPIQPTDQQTSKATSSQTVELATKPDAAAMATAAAGGAAPAAKPVARKLTVEVKAFTESNELSDEQLADLAH
jgi:hypothetical protein